MSKPLHIDVDGSPTEFRGDSHLSSSAAIRAVEVASPKRRRATDGLERASTGRIRRPSFESLRQSPVRNGLIGLAVVGAATPIVVHRHQQALRTNPSHEVALSRMPGGIQGEIGVAGVWKDMLEETEAAAELRDAIVEENLRQYAEFALSRELAEDIYDSATEQDIDPEIAFGLVRAESSFRNTSTSPVGAIGLTQLMPRTADWLEPGVTRSELREPETNLRIGFRYLRSLIDKYGGDADMALVAYNRGPGTVDRALKQGTNPDNGYADFVRGVEGHGHSLYTRK